MILRGIGDKKFKRSFILFALLTLLCPTSSTFIRGQPLHAVVDITHANEYNWAEYLLSSLLDEVRTFKACQRKGKEKKNIGGRLLFLEIFFFEKFPLGVAVVRVGDDILRHWTKKLIYDRTKLERESEQGILYVPFAEPIAHDFEDSLHHPMVRDVFRKVVRYTHELLRQIDQKMMGSSDNVPVDKEDHPSMIQDLESEADGDREAEVLASSTVDLEGPRSVATYKRKRQIILRTRHSMTPRGSSKSVQWSPSVDVKQKQKLYEFYTKRCFYMEGHKIIAEMNQFYLKRAEFECLGGRQWLNMHMMTLVVRVCMENDKRHNSRVTRHILPPDLMVKLSTQQKSFKLDSIYPSILPAMVGYNITDCQLVFAPVLLNDHWFCFVPDPQANFLYILDSLVQKDNKAKLKLTSLTRDFFKEMLRELKPDIYGKRGPSISIHEVELPQQPNVYDCGIHCIKYMEQWTGQVKEEWRGMTMPQYSEQQLQEFRVQLVWDLINHPQNKFKDETMAQAFAG